MDTRERQIATGTSFVSVEPVKKVWILGPAQAGKSDVVCRLSGTVNDFFPQSTTPWEFRLVPHLSVPAPYRRKNFLNLKLELMDFSGHSQYTEPQKNYFRSQGANPCACVFVVDGARSLKDPFESKRQGEDLRSQYEVLTALKEETLAEPNEKSVRILVVNKADQPKKLSDEDIAAIKKLLDIRDPECVVFFSALPPQEEKAYGDGQRLLGILAEKIAAKDHAEHKVENYEDEIRNIFELTAAEENFKKRYLEQAEQRIIDDLRRNALTNEEALGAAREISVLSERVANRRVCSDDVDTFYENTRVVAAKSVRLGRIIGGLIGAALGAVLGLAVGAAIGSGLGPGAALLALGAGMTGALKGASVGAALGATLFGYLGCRFSLWSHPLSRIEKSARVLANQSEALERKESKEIPSESLIHEPSSS